MSADRSNNGYTNYETWVVALWIDNDQGYSQYWQSLADQVSNPNSPEYISDENDQLRFIADQLKADHEENQIPELQGVAADLLNAALSEVDWRDVADSILRTARENQEAA